MFTRLLSRYWLLIPLLVLAIIVRNWIEQVPVVDTLEDTIDMRETQSDYYLEDFTTRKFGNNGVLEYKITGHTLAHYPVDDHSEITLPDVSLHRDGVHWQVVSNTGELAQEPQVLTLQGNVTVQRTATDYQPILIRTSSLSIFTENNEVQTDQAVEVIADTWQLRSVGLHSTLDAGKLTLLSTVTGHYEVAKTK